MKVSELSILYRGPLSSCNYGCEYCPFAKKTESREEHQHDANSLQRFVDWAAENTSIRLSIFFTPWGEALIHKRYQDAIVRLTSLTHVEKVAIQTNLSCSLDWIEHCDKEKLGIWATFHPTEIKREQFLSKCFKAIEKNARFSVGVVGLKEHFDDISFLRTSLPHDVYLWINAYKREPGYYSSADIDFLGKIDHLFDYNNQYHDSIGRACKCGSAVISVDGAGNFTRCHFIKETIGNIYEHGFEDLLSPRPCTLSKCGCHIGYVHIDDLGLYEVFGDGVLERIPAQPLRSSTGQTGKQIGS